MGSIIRAAVDFRAVIYLNFCHIVAVSAVTITGGQVIAGAGTLAALGGLTYMFSKGRPQNNQKQNEQFREVMKRLGIDKRNPKWRKAHDAIEHEPPMNFQELLQFIKDLFGL
ncbi:MAG: hypothetical protein K2P14_00640 [Anaeroplasmataceae bacterium]|nr:hypothetical protein [Anaeroplasmataceae bacterium]